MNIASGSVIRDYTFHEEIGHGGFSVVYRVSSIRFQTEFAAKVISHSRYDSHPTQESYDAELAALKTLSHPNIILVFDAFDHEGSFFIIFELCLRGTLQSEVDSQCHGLSLDRFVEIARPLVDALAYCHERNVSHCDIKPSNILIDSYGRAKLADFGVATILSKSQDGAAMGTFPFMAPEVLLRQETDRRKADVWALGVTFLYMLEGKLPWPNDKFRSAILCGLFTVERELPSTLIHLLHKMLTSDPSLRWSAEEIQGHPALDRIKKKNTEGMQRRGSLPLVRKVYGNVNLSPSQRVGLQRGRRRKTIHNLLLKGDEAGGEG